MQHVPVMLPTVLRVLAPKKGDRILDVTLGLGGHASAFLAAVGSTGFLVGLDADSGNLEFATRVLGSQRNVLTIHANFAALPEILPEEHRSFDVLFADLGLSSPHIDNPERGFTFRSDAPLDMRFDQSTGESAARVLQASDPITLHRIFREYGELTRVPDLVKAIVARRSSEARVRTSGDLVAVAKDIYGFRSQHVLPQIFQALRIHVNDELGALRRLLSASQELLAPGGRLGVLSYHSLEDRIVKDFVKAVTIPAKDPMTGAPITEATYVNLLRKPLRADPEEVSKNPRARSAMFRAIARTSL